MTDEELEELAAELCEEHILTFPEPLQCIEDAKDYIKFWGNTDLELYHHYLLTIYGSR